MTDKKKLYIPHTYGPIIRSSSNGYVVENFIGPVVHADSPNFGKTLPYITKHGRPLVFPDMNSVPPKWRQFAKPASKEMAAIGIRMPRVVNVVTETQMSGGLEVLRKSKLF